MSEPCAKRKRTTRPIDGWEAHAARVKKQRLSEDSVRDDIRSQHLQGQQEPVPHINVSLKYPDSGPRIDVPVRSVNCKHAPCFDLATYLKKHDRSLLGASKKFVTWKCPVCSESAEVHELRVDGYFEAILRKYAVLRNVDEVEILSDATHRPVLQPKVEVIHVSESPFVPPEGADNDDEKPPASNTQDPSSEHESSSESVDNIDMNLAAIKGLSDAQPLCKDAKRRLLKKFKRDAQRKKLEAGEAMNDSSTPVAGEGDGDAASAQADDVDDISSEDGSGLETSITLTALSPRVQQCPSEVAEDYLDPLSLRFAALWFGSDSSDSEFDAPASNRQPPTSLQVIVNTDMVNHDVTDASPPNNDQEELLQKGQYSLAYDKAQRDIGSGDDERFLSVLGDAAYGMRKWELAERHYQEMCDAFPSNEDAKERLRRAQRRLSESRTGIYDIGKLYELGEQGEMDIDVADFLGPIEVVDVPGKGRQALGKTYPAVTPKVRKGFVATQDVKKGTLLMVSKAFAIVNDNTTAAVARGVADKLQLRPEMAAEINALYDGNERTPDAPIDQGIPDIERLSRICHYGWGKCGSYRGLWILPSYFNYSCLTTAYCNIYGDVAMFFAVTDVKKGDEITITGILDPLGPYKLRERVYRDIYGFTCSCRLCELDRADPRYKNRQCLVQLAFKEYAFQSHLFGPTRATGVLTQYVEQLRATYTDRKELRTQMYEPLYSLAKDYMMTDSRDGYEMALKLFAEITQCLDERLLREVGVCIYDKMAACYDNLDDEANARKYARMAADVDRICTGSDDALFKKKYENSARCKHLL